MITKLAIARQLASSSDREARAACARFTWISSDLITLLSGDKHSLVREALASNPSASLEVLRGFEHDVAPHVREAANKNYTKQTSGEGLSVANTAPEFDEQWMTAGMPDDQAQMFRLTLSGNLSEQEAEDLITFGNDWVRAYVAFPKFAFGGKVNEPPKFAFGSSILDRLLNDESGLVRAALARNPHIPPCFYGVLATDEDRRVKEMLCLNPRTPMVILEKFAASGSWRMLVRITENESVPLD